MHKGNINLTSNELGKVNVTFDSVTDASKYKIERSEHINNNFITLTDSLTTTNDYDDTGLDDGKLYFYKITSSKDATPDEKKALNSTSIVNIASGLVQISI